MRAAREVAPLAADRELEGARLVDGERLAGDGKVRPRQSKDQIVEAGPQAMEAIAQDQAELFKEPFTYDRVIDVLSAIRLELSADSIAISSRGVLDSEFECLKMGFGAVEPKPDGGEGHAS